MADPFAIVGLASSILTFIEFGIKVVSLAKLIRESQHGSIPEVQDLHLIIQHVRSLSASLKERPPSKKLSADEQNVVSMAARCDQLASELETMLEKLKLRTNARSRPLDTGRLIILAMRKKNDIESLQARLVNLDRSLREAINNTLQQERHSAILFELNVLRAMQWDMEVAHSPVLEGMQSEIAHLTSVDGVGGLSREQLEHLKERLDFFAAEYAARKRASKVLQRLAFSELRRRKNRITDAQNDTYSWLFSRRTGFVEWLEAGTGIYWITGKAGSGKSTLMKFASDHPETKKALDKWTADKTLYHASFYFWNQGFELQKSQKGLLRTLLFEMLRKMPSVIQQVCPEEPEQPDEEWGVEQLKTILQRVVSTDHGSARFCFFIDGLDEYHGDEEDLVAILSFFSDTLDIKLCVSSRPRLVLDEAFEAHRKTLVISDHTKEGMKTHVRAALESNPKFKRLRADHPPYDEIITQIAEISKGVWLWVDLVTHDLVRAVNRNEEIDTLQKIINQFPRELEEYFKFIIDGVRPPFRDEMARIFLVTIEEVQPLPLYALSLLRLEEGNPEYAITAPIVPLGLRDIEGDFKIRKDRLQNRCRDLLVVEDGPHPTFLTHPVDFLHRTVHDFLRDWYYDQLKSELTSSFDPLISLCNMMLYLLKGLPALSMSDPASITRFIKLVDELLYYAYEAERRSPLPTSHPNLVRILDELDRVGAHHVRHLTNNHWTHIRDSPRTRGADEYREGGNGNFLALAVQARLTKYVAAKLDADPARLRKSGRPLLDYALRPLRVTPVEMPYHSRRAEASVDCDMVRLLLERGAKPNQPVHLNDGRTVWALFLLSCHESARRDEASSLLVDAWYRACELLIQHGAEAETWFGDGLLRNSEKMMGKVFGGDRARELRRLATDVRAQRQSNGWRFFGWFSG